MAREQADHYALKNGALRLEPASLPARLAGPLARMADTTKTRSAMSRAITRCWPRCRKRRWSRGTKITLRAGRVMQSAIDYLNRPFAM